MFGKQFLHNIGLANINGLTASLLGGKWVMAHYPWADKNIHGASSNLNSLLAIDTQTTEMLCQITVSNKCDYYYLKWNPAIWLVNLLQIICSICSCSKQYL
jgi:hypothetical protein